MNAKTCEHRQPCTAKLNSSSVANKTRHQRPPDLSNIMLDRLGCDDNISNRNIICERARSSCTINKPPCSRTEEILRLNSELDFAQSSQRDGESKTWNLIFS